MVVARLVYPPKVVSVSQTALTNAVHIEHLVLKFWEPPTPEWVTNPPSNGKPPPWWPWKARTACGQSRLDACPVTWKGTSQCLNCQRYWNRELKTEADDWYELRRIEGGMVLLDSDIEMWMQRVLEWAKLRRVRTPIPSLDDALRDYELRRYF